MAIKESKKVSVVKSSVFQRLGGSAQPNGCSNSGYTNRVVCRYWLAGTCKRNPCRFVHQDMLQPRCNTYLREPKNQQLGNSFTQPNSYHRVPEQKSGNASSNGGLPMRKLYGDPKLVAAQECQRKNGTVKGDNHTCPSQLKYENDKTVYKVCPYWKTGNCTHGDNCEFIHSWFVGTDFFSLAKLQGHKKGITGIALPSGSNKLFSSSRDGALHVWDCQSGQCSEVIELGGEIGSLISEGPWIYVGMPNVVKAWNIQTLAHFDLPGPVGQVYAMLVSNEMLFAGAQDGDILVWKVRMETNSFQELACLKGHTLPVVSFVVGGNFLYSGSCDHTIRRWNMETLQCDQILQGHSDAVMSVLCWEDYLLSCSLDQTIKVWACNEEGNLEVVHIHNEKHGVLALYGMYDADKKPILYRSCSDNTVCLYDLPSFAVRGRIFSNGEVRTIQRGPDGVFFTGDGTGLLTVWKWFEKNHAAGLTA